MVSGKLLEIDLLILFLYFLFLMSKCNKTKMVLRRCRFLVFSYCQGAFKTHAGKVSFGVRGRKCLIYCGLH